MLNDRTTNRHTLTLTTRQSLRLTLEQRNQTQDISRTRNALVDGIFVEFLQLEAERHVLVNIHVRIERIGLEHHTDITLYGRNIVHVLATDGQFTIGDVFQTGNHTQQRRFTTA